MKYLIGFSRVVLGLIFVVFGFNGFLHFIPTTQFPGVAGQFIAAIFKSHFYVVVFLTQITGGLLLLLNRYVPLGLLILGPVLVNILSFHLLMSAPGIPLALVATTLWLIVFSGFYRAFSGTGTRRPATVPPRPRPQDAMRDLTW
jgi:putative oxidoreductase